MQPRRWRVLRRKRIGIGSSANSVSCQLICVDMTISTAQPIYQRGQPASNALARRKYDAIHIIRRAR